MSNSSTTGAPLAIRDLRVTFRGAQGEVQAVAGVDIDVMPGKVSALVGESGSGKSASVLAALRLLPAQARVTGRVDLDGTDLLTLKRRQLDRIRGKSIGMVFQDPMTSLNPVQPVGVQLAEAVRLHNPRIGKTEVRNRVLELMNAVGISGAKRRADAYPHEFSGGMRQRLVIATAVANKPRFVIADEPTTALDVTVQAQVLDLLLELCSAHNSGLLLVTHDLGIVAGIADDVYVMREGEIVERGRVERLFERPQHEYTRQLLDAVPRLDRPRGAGHAPFLQGGSDGP